MIRIAAVIVTYNRKEKLRRCVKAVLDQNCSFKPDVIVVDNNSSDSTSGLFTGSAACFDDSRVLYFNTGLNTGGAGGFTFGIRKACELGYDYVWLMDDDCIPAADALGVFVRFDTVHNGEYGFLSSRVLWKDGSLCRMNIQRERVFRNISNERLQHAETPISVEMASFISLFIPTQIVREVGLPFRKFFIWTDDWEYTRRISAEYPCWVIPGSNVVHETDTNEGADISTAPAESLGRFTYLYRNDVYLYRREGLKGFVYEVARLTAHAARIMTSEYSFREKKKRLAIMINGTAEGIEFFPEPERVNPPEMELKK